MLSEHYDELKTILKDEMRAKLRREYLHFLDECDEVKDDARRDVMVELEIELLQIEGRECQGDDTYRESFIHKVQHREVIVKMLNEPLDWGCFES